VQQDSVLIVTRAKTLELCSIQQRFLALPFPQRLLFNHDGRVGGLSYFLEVCDLGADWVINLDEDAFVFDNTRILKLLEFMKTAGYECCGMPDGGVCIDRTNSPLVFNAFFNIINVKAIRDVFNHHEVENLEFDERWKSLINSNYSPTTYRLFSPRHGYFYESYYRFFYWLLKQGFRFLPLNVSRWREDDPAVILKDHEERPFLLHSWFARNYAQQAERFNRILHDVTALCEGRQVHTE
jgi:hypothetical protein